MSSSSARQRDSWRWLQAKKQGPGIGRSCRRWPEVASSVSGQRREQGRSEHPKLLFLSCWRFRQTTNSWPAKHGRTPSHLRRSVNGGGVAEGQNHGKELGPAPATGNNASSDFWPTAGAGGNPASTLPLQNRCPNESHRPITAADLRQAPHQTQMPSQLALHCNCGRSDCWPCCCRNDRPACGQTQAEARAV
jgi:hypothetical protein